MLDQGTTAADPQFSSNKLWNQWYSYELLVNDQGKNRLDSITSTAIIRMLNAPLEPISLHICGRSNLPLKTLYSSV